MMLLDFINLPKKSRQEILLKYSAAVKQVKNIDSEKILLGLIYYQIIKDNIKTGFILVSHSPQRKSRERNVRQVEKFV
jgi:hypothetical protein